VHSQRQQQAVSTSENKHTVGGPCFLVKGSKKKDDDMSKRRKQRCYLAVVILITYPCSALFLPFSPPSSMANAGGTLPELVLDYAEQYNSKDAEDSKTSKYGKDAPFFWTDRLGKNASEAILDRYQRAFPELSTSSAQNPFSVLTWNILSQNLYDISMLKKCAVNQQVYKFSWEERLGWMLDSLSKADADVVCLQEVEFQSFHQDLLPAMQKIGYDGAVQGGHNVNEVKRRKGKGQRAHVVATFWKTDRFEPVDVNPFKNVESALLARGRTMTSLLQDKKGSPILAVINCHLEGHPNQYSARIRQLQHAMDDLVVRCSGVPLNGLCIAGDLNCELQSSVCSTYLRIGRVGRKGGLGGVHGTSAIAVPPVLLECDEAAECLGPILEWGRPIPNDELESVQPHPFRRNSLCSAYPPSLGQADPRQHFTFCANPNRPVAGLDQIWYSRLSLTRMALRKPLSTPNKRSLILTTGLPAPGYPSDHLPIGTILDWTTCDPISSRRKVRELIVTPKEALPVPKSKSPIMAYTELDMLLVTCPYDSEKQRLELEAIVEDVPDLPPDNQKPSPEQLRKLSEMRERKKLLLMCASENVRIILQRILKLRKEVSAY
jgi:mRNA deadenylase 3'-5' endonuclease subunit Ccr4